MHMTFTIANKYDEGVGGCNDVNYVACYKVLDQ